MRITGKGQSIRTLRRLRPSVKTIQKHILRIREARRLIRAQKRIEEAKYFLAISRGEKDAVEYRKKARLLGEQLLLCDSEIEAEKRNCQLRMKMKPRLRSSQTEVYGLGNAKDPLYFGTIRPTTEFRSPELDIATSAYEEIEIFATEELC